MIGLVATAVLQQAGPQALPPVGIDLRGVPFPGLAEPRTVGCLSLRAGLTLETKRDGFGGYSDLSLDGPDGLSTLVSDGGHVLWVRFGFDAAGDLVSAADARLAGMVERDGSTLGKRDGDAEGLAWLGGGYAVSFEGEHRLARMGVDGVLGETSYPAPGDARAFGLNSGLEALTRLADGRLIAMSEGTDANGDAVVLRGRMDRSLSDWDRARYRPAAGFSVTGASADPLSGDLFVLERAYSPWRGVRMRVVRVPADALDADVLRGRQLTRMGFLEGIDNMEGIAAARTETGALRLYLVSDDNYSAAQRTIVLTLGLAPGCEDGDAAQPPARGDAASQDAVEDQEGR